MAGVQQPGMTGQVKEDILNRWFELGVSVKDGQLTFSPTMLRHEDFKDGELRFTYCGTEIIYRLSKSVCQSEGRSVLCQAKPVCVLTKEQSAHIFARDGQIPELEIQINYQPE
jgi:hypothetical protein